MKHHDNETNQRIAQGAIEDGEDQMGTMNIDLSKMPKDEAREVVKAMRPDAPKDGPLKRDVPGGRAWDCGSQGLRRCLHESRAKARACRKERAEK